MAKGDNVDLRVVVESDLDTIAEMALGRYPNNFEGTDGDPAEWANRWIQEYAARHSPDSPFAHNMVATIDRRIVGYILTDTPAGPAGKVRFYEWGVPVHEGGQGIGPKLISSMKDFWEEQHPIRFGGKPLDTIWVYTGKDGAGLCRVKFGFGEVAAIKDAYGPGPEGVEYIMERKAPFTP